MMVPAGSKRSLNLTFDFVDEKQSLGGYRTLNLLNVNSDPTFVQVDALFGHRARLLPGAEDQLHARGDQRRELGRRTSTRSSSTRTSCATTSRPTRARAGRCRAARAAAAAWSTWGDDPAGYKRTYEIKTKDDPKVWADLIRMFKVLNETPPDKLEAALSPLLDIDGALKFLAVDIALVNTDGYWTRGSDYSIYQDVKGQFHVIPHDMNEALINEGGRGGRGPGGPPPDFARGSRRWPGGPPPGGLPAGDGPPRRPRIRPGRRRSDARPADRPERSVQSRCARSCWRCRRCGRGISLTCATSPNAGSTGRSWVRWRGATRPHRATK